MNPVITQLIPTVISLLEEAGKTEVGKKFLDKGKRIIEVSLPMVQKASNITIDFLSTDLGKELFSGVREIKLSKSLGIVERGLSLPASYYENQNASINQDINKGFDIVRGQNEILFLSNSISYFVESHKPKVGIDRNISHALQYDVIAVCSYLEKRNDIRFPGYLLHQIQSLSSTIRELNIFYDSICKDGYVPDFNKEDLVVAMKETVGVEGRSEEHSDYYPWDIKIDAMREVNKERGKASSDSRLFIRKFFDRDNEMLVSNGVHDALVILKEELISNETLENKIIKKLNILPDKKLMIESF